MSESTEVTLTMTLKKNPGDWFTPGVPYFEVMDDGWVEFRGPSRDMLTTSLGYIPVASLSFPDDAPQWAKDAVEAVRRHGK